MENLNLLPLNPSCQNPYVRRISLIVTFALFVEFCVLFGNNYIISSSLCLISGVFIFDGGNNEKIGIENYIIIIIGLVIFASVFVVQEKAWENIYTTI